MIKYLLKICFKLTMSFLLFIQSNFAHDEGTESSKTFSFQDYLLTNGIDFEGSFLGDYFSNLSGGIQNEDSFVDNIVLRAGFDMNKLAGVDGMSLYLSSLGIQGETFLQNSGAMQGISNIAGVNHWKLYEVWVEQNFLNEDLSFLFGLYDLNSEFDVRESSGIFINPSFGIGFDFAQSGENGSSIFPYTSLALRIKYNLSESLEILTAVFDGVPGSLIDDNGLQVQWSLDEGTLLSTELIFSPSRYEYGKNYYKYSIGGWYFTSDFENLSTGVKETGNYGIYASGEHFIYSESYTNHEGLALFGRIGIASSSFNPSDFSALGGVNYTGLIPGRNEDVFGFAFTSIHLTDEFRVTELYHSEFETILELTYSFQMTDWMRLQPDIQYVFNPVFAGESDYEFTAGIRAELAF